MKKGMLGKTKRLIFSAAVIGLSIVQVITVIPAWALGKPDVSSSVMNPLINETTTALAPGIQEKNLTFINPQGDRTELFAVDVDLSNQNTAIYAGTPADGNSYAMQTVRDQANAAIKNGKNVVAAINGDYYNMATGEPLGMELKDGVEIKDNGSWNFFGMKKDGTPVIGTSALYEQIKGDLQQALGGPKILVENGQPYDSPDEIYPCAAVGIRKDNSVFFVTVDGKQAPYSNGIMLRDLARLLIDMGAEQALMLDGGGSATYVSKSAGDDSLTCKNRPSDGTERVVANSWLIVSKAEPDHQFASAHILPYDNTFTPNAAIDFTAKGVDAAGFSAPLPESGLSWSVSDTSFGTIDAATGVFQSNGKTGEFKAQLNYKGSVVGTTNVEIAVPDDIHFVQPELSLKFDVSQSLGLVARYQGRDVHLHAGDIQWDFDAGLGTMDDKNIFHAGSSTSSGTVTAMCKKADLSASINLKVGQLPVIMYDFEDGLGDWGPSTAGKGEVSDIALSTYPDDLTRFGNNSLRINYDFTNAQKNTTLGVYAGPTESKEIPGMPAAIGMWVYATPEAQGYWLRMYVYDAKGIYKPIDLTTQSEGINWTGWRYVEAAIPSTYQGPFTTFPNQMIRMMSLKSGMTGPMTKGSIYVDNIRAVYGANVDDLYPPVIDSVSVDGKTYTSQSVNIHADIHDNAADQYMTGINWSRVKILVDGKDYSADQSHFSYDKDGYINLNGLSWPDGVHKATVDIQDNFGNETTKDVYFTVNSHSGTKVELTPETSTAALGGKYLLHINTNHASDIQGITANIQITKDFPVSNVEFDPSVEANSSYSYDDSTGIVTVTVGAPSDAAKSENNSLATVEVSVPSDIKSGSKLEYSMVDSDIQYKDDKGENFCPTFSALPGSVAIKSAYLIKLQNSIVGEDGRILVTGQTGLPAGGTTVIMKKEDGSSTELGETDSDGILVSPELTACAQKFTLMAEKDDQYSFELSTQSYNPAKDIVPGNIMTGTTADPKTQKSITWMSNPLTGGTNPVMQYALKSEYGQKGEAAFQNAAGSSQVLFYDTDSEAVRENSVVVKGLKPGTTYSYRVGDGTNWSEVGDFTTMADTDKLIFNVFGDTQSGSESGLDDLSQILDAIETNPEPPAFSIHVGDFVDDEQVFNQIDYTTSMFNKHPKFNSIDMVHVLGNHEYQGDDGTKASTIYGVPQNGPTVNTKGCYSTDYGNVHVAVLGWTDSKDLMQKELDWLRKDVAASDKTWKIVATHQPVYNKNPADAGSTMFHDMLAPVCDELGIDFVFNGHDHSYGRTFPVINNQKAENGTVYIAAGHTAEKTYDALPTDPSVYDFYDTNNQNKVYITCKVNGKELTVEAKTSDGTVIDTYTAAAKERADKLGLQQTIMKAETLQESRYTSTSWAALQTALEAAKKINANAAATQIQVNDALTKLRAAVNGLVKRSSSNNAGGSSSTIPAVPNNPATPSTTIITTNPAGVTVAAVATKPNAAPVVTGGHSAVAVTVPADVTSVISAATDKNRTEIRITAPTTVILDQLKNTGVKAVDLTIQVPSAVAGNTNANAKVSITAEQAVLQAAKDTQKDIIIKVADAQTGKEAYSWTFSGTGLKNSVASVTAVNINLNVIPVKSDAQTSAIVAQSSTGRATSGIVLKFGENNLLPGPAAVRVYVGDQEGCKPNSTMYLYYLNSVTKVLEQLPKSQCIIDQDGYATVTVAYGRYYVLLPQPATNLYPVRSDTTYPVGVKNGKTYTFGITVSGNAVPSLMVGNSGVFVSTVRRQGSKYYVTVKAVGAPGAMTAIYSTLPKQKPVILCYIAAEK